MSLLREMSPFVGLLFQKLHPGAAALAFQLPCRLQLVRLEGEVGSGMLLLLCFEAATARRKS